MADPFGIAGLLGVALQIFHFSTRLGLAWKDAPADVRKFLEELQALKTVLSETTVNLQLKPELVEAFRGKHSAVLSQLGSNESTDTRILLASCEHELRQLLQDLQKRSQGHRLGWERLKSAFTASNMREAVESLRRRCDLINSLVNLDALSLGASIHEEVTGLREEQRQHHEISQIAVSELRSSVENVHGRQISHEEAILRQAVLEWLSPIDYAAEQNDNVGRRQPGTGEWLLTSDEFNSWVQSPGRTMFCPGIPGAGKTILASMAIQSVAERFHHDNDIAVIQVYCNFSRKDQQKARDLLLSLLRQLCASSNNLPIKVRELYSHHHSKRTIPTTEEICRTLRSVAVRFTRVYTFVDALDECQSLEGHRDEFIEQLLVLQQHAPVNLFFTSRLIPEIADKINHSIKLEIRASEDDVKRYLQAHLPNLPKFVARKPELQQEIVSNISRAINGMYVAKFLLAKLYLDSLIGTSSPKALRAALGKISTGSGVYDEAYDDAMKRINGQLPQQQELAKRVLCWIVCAGRQLRTAELQEALAIERGEPRLDRDNIADVEDMVSVCAGLVTVEEESQVVRLVHYTAQEYFERTQVHWFPDAHLDIAADCFTYLSFETFVKGRLDDVVEFKQRVEHNPLYTYVCEHWGFHCRLARLAGRRPPNFPRFRALQFLKLEGQRAAASQALFAVQELYTASTRFVSRYPNPRNVSALHLAAYFDIYEVIGDLYHAGDPIPADSLGRSPLVYAAEAGRTKTVRLLMEVIPKRYWEGEGDITPLHATARIGNINTAQVLLDGGFPVDAIDEFGSTTLHLAAELDRVGLTKLLLANCATANLPNHRGRTPLMTAALYGNTEICRLLLDHGVDPNEMMTTSVLLGAFSSYGNSGVVKALLDGGIRVDVLSANGRSALHEATSLFSAGRAISHLIDSGADIDKKDAIISRTPLMHAVVMDNHAAMRTLLERGANTALKDCLGQTALWMAVELKRRSIFQMLLEHSADMIDVSDSYGSTPLSVAARHGLIEILEILLSNLEMLAMAVFIVERAAGETSIYVMIVTDLEHAAWMRAMCWKQ
ncbi:hypothetical protein S40288_07540 [Stachybotrys chartarum IBT 40288]|nr:hypothetical protein S40288_07540 [Stachybotrys chartarum IBT 40288]